MAKRNADVVIVHAAELVTCAGPPEGVRGAALQRLETIADGALAIRDGRILAVGPTAAVSRRYVAPVTIDASGRLVSPGLVDPHSHLLYGGSRHEEYEAKVTQRAPARRMDGGIRYTVRKTAAASDAELLEQAYADLDTMLLHGTTTLEAKTGYGLERDAELRLLRLTAGLRHAVDVVPTLLALHVLPDAYADRRADYLAAAVGALEEASGLATYCDVSCDPLCFTFDECMQVGAAARAAGMKIRVHADQFGDAGGALAAARLHASAADHLDYASDAGLRAMAAAGTVATFLPGVTLHMCEMTPRFADGALADAEKPFMPLVVRRAIEAGVTVALSTDYNPGSCPTPSMQIVMALAARLFRLGYAEIWNMCTLNGARALDLAADRGSLEAGKRADIVVWNVPGHGMAINRFGVNLADTVIANGAVVVEGGRLKRGRARHRTSAPARRSRAALARM
ncbi:MAG: imidazolonepropionase [Burkholderiales bacterium]|nr:imidazolonepropionase [Burkholderiales bacterium]